MSQEHSLLVDTGVIFSAQQLERSADFYRKGGITPPYWTPSFEDIARLERQLKPYLAGEPTPQAKQIGTKPGKRQYLGYTNDGRRWIFVNSLCEWLTKDRPWREDFIIIIVFDGGSCFFTVRYDLSNSQFDELRINGPWRF